MSTSSFTSSALNTLILILNVVFYVIVLVVYVIIVLVVYVTTVGTRLRGPKFVHYDVTTGELGGEERPIKGVSLKLGKVDKWLCANKLFINYSKTKFLLFNKISKNCKFSVKINGFLIEQSDSIKYLGVFLDDKLN